MVGINDVTIFSVDKGEEIWEIEGEIIFEGDLSTPFTATYAFDYDDLEEVSIEINPGPYDRSLLKEMILNAVNEAEEYDTF